MIRIAILDDHRIVIDGLKMLLKDQLGLTVVAEHTNGANMLESMEKIPVDILLTDMMMPDMDGFEVAIRVRKRYPDVKIIALSMNGDGPLVEKMVDEVGVNAYLLKTANKNELLDAIKAVADHQTYYSPEILNELESYRKLKQETDLVRMTAREIEIIRCIAADLSNKMIADTLFISERTVETHRKNIFRKAGVHSVVGLIDFARNNMLI
jgi:DNA-binding NarL/FixJ family response regulator